ncbi:uncharacterized protein Ecym_6225 [Eremothecium cymbalariae DBVPG|uniref:CCHC-type domain-containing protein n=1 Tax=Eremothecium cymbalariae (strain CBS 270.75 / DBVPG 7215 / KCTC 17166 / NRRL Y-17582) TaxID=931890 RepID=G8JVC8_ERECY|nr:hypothetical protein Ecym_6225 [Eremothecium cymbalariae DBVPG\
MESSGSVVGNPSMEVLLRVLADRQQQQQRVKAQYEQKLQNVVKLTESLLVSCGDGNPKVDVPKLDEVLGGGLQVIEREGRTYALVPLEEVPSGQGVERQRQPEQRKNKGKRKKKNQIACSYCHEIGHTRGACEKRLLNLGSR